MLTNTHTLVEKVPGKTQSPRSKRQGLVNIKKGLRSWSLKKNISSLKVLRLISSIVHEGTNREQIISLSAQMEEGLKMHMGDRIPVNIFLQLFNKANKLWKELKNVDGEREVIARKKQYMEISYLLLCLFTGGSLLNMNVPPLIFCNRDLPFPF